MNGLRVREYMPERNFLVHNPQTSFEVACSLCKTTAIHDTIAAGVASSLPPIAFYAGSPALPSTLARHKHHARDTPAIVDTPSAASSLTEALNKLT